MSRTGPWVETEDSLGNLYPFRIRVEARKDRARADCRGIEKFKKERWRSPWVRVQGAHNLTSSQLATLAITLSDTVIDWAEDMEGPADATK